MMILKAVQVYEGSGPLPPTYTVHCGDYYVTWHEGSRTLKHLLLKNLSEEAKLFMVDLKLPNRMTLLVRANGLAVIKECMFTDKTWFTSGESIRLTARDEP